MLQGFYVVGWACRVAAFMICLQVKSVSKDDYQVVIVSIEQKECIQKGGGACFSPRYQDLRPNLCFTGLIIFSGNNSSSSCSLVSRPFSKTRSYTPLLRSSASLATKVEVS